VAFPPPSVTIRQRQFSLRRTNSLPSAGPLLGVPLVLIRVAQESLAAFSSKAFRLQLRASIGLTVRLSFLSSVCHHIGRRSLCWSRRPPDCSVRGSSAEAGDKKASKSGFYRATGCCKRRSRNLSASLIRPSSRRRRSYFFFFLAAFLAGLAAAFFFLATLRPPKKIR
jgi:hypothetical protein